MEVLNAMGVYGISNQQSPTTCLRYILGCEPDITLNILRAVLMDAMDMLSTGPP